MKKLVITLSILAGIVLIVVGVYKIFLASKVPQGFLDKYNEAVSLDKEYVKISTAIADSPEMKELDNKIGKGDFSGAIKSIDIILIEKNKALAKVKLAGDKIAEVKAMLGKISDADAKANAEKMISYMEKENAAKVKFAALQVQLLEKSKEQNSYLKSKNGNLSVSDKTNENIGKQIDTITKQIDDTKKEVENLQSQYQQLETEFFKSANLSIDTSSN